jgi:hypothetical protein
MRYPVNLSANDFEEIFRGLLIRKRFYLLAQSLRDRLHVAPLTEDGFGS